MIITKQNLTESGIKTLTFNANIMKDADGNKIADIMDEAFKTQAAPSDGFQLIDGKRKTEAQFFVQNDGWFVRVEYAYKTTGEKVINKADLMFSILDKDLLAQVKADPLFRSGEIYTFDVAKFPDLVAAQASAQSDAPAPSAKDARAAKQAAKKAEHERKIAEREDAKKKEAQRTEETVAPAAAPAPAPVAPAPVAAPSPAPVAANPAPVAVPATPAAAPTRTAAPASAPGTPIITTRETVVTPEMAAIMNAPAGSTVTGYSATAQARVGDITINFAFPAGFTPVDARGPSQEKLSIEGTAPNYSIQLRSEIPADQKGKIVNYSIITREGKNVRLGVMIREELAANSVQDAGVLGALSNDTELSTSLNETGLSADMLTGTNGLASARSAQIGTGGLGARGSGLGGGGIAEGLGTLGTRIATTPGTAGALSDPHAASGSASTGDSAYDYLLPQITTLRDTKFKTILDRHFLRSRTNATGTAQISVDPEGKVTAVDVSFTPSNSACESELEALIKKTKFQVQNQNGTAASGPSVEGSSLTIELPINYTVTTNG